MQKYLFLNDYSEGAHPNILKALSESNDSQEQGYGYDQYSDKARELIKQECQSEPKIYFVSGGTQANQVALSSMLRSFESVISADSGHIATHEAGSIEATGHKINTIVTKDGKLTSEQIDLVVKSHNDEHMVKPKVVFISNTTEVGTTYNKAELEALSKYCHENDLYLYLDGARLAMALVSNGNDLTLADISRLTDMFYIGGTKNGALLGEALVINNQKLQLDFVRQLKQRGALLAKGRVLGIQFQELFSNDLFYSLGRKANETANILTEGIKLMGFNFLTESNTNQVFPIFPNKIISELEKLYGFYVWEKIDEENSAIRLVTSWVTKEEVANEFLKDLKDLI